ncbi:MAG: cytochrome c biogenesis protein CcdA [Desulfopila sp.]|jgi:cytochrome c biogenesis protein CcdA|nr:cytochrome c biogenesis protein CcdA [Desulfopila sp.]
MEIQALVSQWLSQMAAYLPLGYAFGAGMVSAVNPCGFAMLPVYLSLYIGVDGEEYKNSSIIVRFAKAVWVAVVVTSGFGLLFGLVGLMVSAGGAVLSAIMPWIAMFVGAVLLLLGGAILLGRHLSFNFMLRLANRIGDPRQLSLKGFFLFGVAFGATSLSCTLPIFIAVMGSSFASGNFVEGLWQFFSYILGMGAVLLTLTLGMAFVKEGVVVGALRKLLPYVEKVSAVLIIFAGAYILYYWLSSGLLF